ncbi:MAG: hydroxymethylbilane synthase [Bauldia sp.]|nr:hydroxymethylbilane synthase [Bauldia sp.]
MQSILRIGTRGSKLALAQAEETRARLASAHKVEPERFEIVPIKTTGDRITDRPLAESGGKGLFTKEIEEALLRGEVDLAVHSGKDMPTETPAGLALAACLPREDVRDVFISAKAKSLDLLVPGSRLGTSSLRRKALVLRARPDLEVVDIRGNVETRLKRMEEGKFDAIVLAMAGLNRLGLGERATDPLDITDFPPAVAQGAIAIETRAGDTRVLDLLAAIDDRDTRLAVICERAFLAALEGSCRTPIAGLAAITAGALHFSGLIITPDGRTAHETERLGMAEDAAELGADAGVELRERGGPSFFAAA